MAEYWRTRVQLPPPPPKLEKGRRQVALFFSFNGCDSWTRACKARVAGAKRRSVEGSEDSNCRRLRQTYKKATLAVAFCVYAAVIGETAPEGKGRRRYGTSTRSFVLQDSSTLVGKSNPTSDRL